MQKSLHFVMLIHSISSIIYSQGQQSVCSMSDQSDSQNLSEQQVVMSEGTSPSSSSDEGSRSTPSNLPKAATRQRKKKTSDSEDEDYVAEEEATSKRIEPAQGTKPGLKIKRPAGRQPMSKARASTEKPTSQEPAAAEGKKRKERVKKTVARVLGKASIMEEEEEEEAAAPAPKAPKLMGDAIRSGGAASKPKEAPKAASKPKSAPKRNTRSIPATEKNKAPVPETVAEDEEENVLRKLKPKIPDHNDAHPVAEDMKLRRDSGLRKWREADPYASRRRTAVDYRFHTKEQQDFYETVLLDKKPIVCDMRWVDWTYIKDNEEYYPGVFDSFSACGVADFVGQKLTKWNEELIMQFYSTAHFYPDGRITWMSEGTRYHSTVEEWAKLINAPEEQADDLDIYAKKKMDHNSMSNMYKEIPNEALDTFKFGSVHYLLSGLPTINWILRHTLLPKSGDHKMIRGHAINLLHVFDVPQKFKVMSLIVETIKRTAADQKRSCGYAPQIQELINSKMGTGVYLLDKEHLPIRPDFEDNQVVMTENEPSSAHAQAQKEKAKKEKAARMPTQAEASDYFLKTKQEQLGYLIASTLRIEQSIATLTQNQASLERIMEQRFYDLDIKVTEIQTAVEQLQEDMNERRGRTTTDAFARVPRGPRSSALPVADTRATTSAPATASVPPAPASTSASTPTTSTEGFVLGVLRTPPPPEDQA